MTISAIIHAANSEGVTGAILAVVGMVLGGWWAARRGNRRSK